MRLNALATCAVVAPLLIGAAAPVRLQPSSKWVVDYGEDSCHLLRSFGEGNAETTLLFESESPGDVDMLVIGNPLKTDRDQVVAEFLPFEDVREKGLPVTSGDKRKPGILFGEVELLPADEQAALDAERAAHKAKSSDRPPAINPVEKARRKSKRLEFASMANELAIETGYGHYVVLETGSLGDPIKTFDQCSRNSLRDWGVDPDLEDKIVRPVWPVNPARWFDPEDYPREMLDDGQQSNVKARVLVDASGRVTKCTSLSHFKLPQFNQLVCDTITKVGKFEPAELGDGTKVPSYYTLKVNFRVE